MPGKVGIAIRDALGGQPGWLLHVTFIGWPEAVNQAEGVRGSP